ncbi:hypothetical protein T06_11904 [Trichinella sp. T6]|nr:hypothetical protein T06_11904 [Trichinella sp. T6]
MLHKRIETVNRILLITSDKVKLLTTQASSHLLYLCTEVKVMDRRNKRAEIIWHTKCVESMHQDYKQKVQKEAKQAAGDAMKCKIKVAAE